MIFIDISWVMFFFDAKIFLFLFIIHQPDIIKKARKSCKRGRLKGIKIVLMKKKKKKDYMNEKDIETILRMKKKSWLNVGQIIIGRKVSQGFLNSSFIIHPSFHLESKKNLSFLLNVYIISFACRLYNFLSFDL